MLYEGGKSLITPAHSLYQCLNLCFDCLKSLSLEGRYFRLIVLYCRKNLLEKMLNLMETLTSNPTVEKSDNTLFYYQNKTNQIQIIQLTPSIPGGFEKTIFPDERVLFYSSLDATLNIYHGTTEGLILVERVPCSQLQGVETCL